MPADARPLRGWLAACACLLLAGPAFAGYYPVFSTWPQPQGPGSAITLHYSFSNLLDGSLLSPAGQPLAADLLRDAVAQALGSYAEILPIHFVEVADAGPAPESGEYDPTGLPEIRIGQVPSIATANAYAYFPRAGSGLAGDVVFSAARYGLGWTPSFFFAVAQHELGHSLGLGHYVGDNPAPAQDLGYGGPVYPLDDETIAALQAAYGAGVGSVTPMAPVPEVPPAALLAAGLLLLGWRRHASRPRSPS